MKQASIIKLLKRDHREVSRLLKDALATTVKYPRKRDEVFSEIRNALTVHTHFEEMHLYPVLEERRGTKDSVLEAAEEHEQIKHLLQIISETPATDEHWKARMKVLAEDVRHHVKEEEKSGGLFEVLSKRLSAGQLLDLGISFEMEKELALSESL